MIINTSMAAHLERIRSESGDKWSVPLASQMWVDIQQLYGQTSITISRQVFDHLFWEFGL